MPSAPLALLNGRFIPAAELTIPAYDAGFVLGATVSEQLRTFGGKLYKLDEHLARLLRGLEITAIDLRPYTGRLVQWAYELVEANHKLLDPADDLGLSIFVTPGPYPTLAPPDVAQWPTIGMSTYPLPFHLWADKYETGERLVVSDVRQVSADCWPRELKCRSRMHYYLAEQEVRRRSPGARPLLLDEHGNVNETPTANIIGFTDTDGAAGFISPHDVLDGISKSTVRELWMKHVARPCSWQGGNVRPDVLWTMVQELWLTSTPFCLLPVVKLDDAPIGDGRPGPIYRRLLEAWSGEVGVDIAAQARRFSTRRAS